MGDTMTKSIIPINVHNPIPKVMSFPKQYTARKSFQILCHFSDAIYQITIISTFKRIYTLMF